MMKPDPIIERVRDAIRARAEKPDSERIADMIARGVIDEKGRVLLRMPREPEDGAKGKAPG